jgi:hypothetical protein
LAIRRFPKRKLLFFQKQDGTDTYNSDGDGKHASQTDDHHFFAFGVLAESPAESFVAFSETCERFIEWIAVESSEQFWRLACEGRQEKFPC